MIISMTKIEREKAIIQARSLKDSGMCTREVSQRLGIKISTLYKWRVFGRGTTPSIIPYVMMTDTVRKIIEAVSKPHGYGFQVILSKELNMTRQNISRLLLKLVRGGLIERSSYHTYKVCNDKLKEKL